MNVNELEGKYRHCQYGKRHGEIQKPDTHEVEYVHLEHSYVNYIEEINRDEICLYRTTRENSDHNTFNTFHIYPKYYD